jgi:hypothetical protein
VANDTKGVIGKQQDNLIRETEAAPKFEQQLKANGDLHVRQHEHALVRAFVTHKFPVTLPAHYDPSGS